jgi:hypothetical protein
MALPSLVGFIGYFAISAARGILPISPVIMVLRSIGQLGVLIALPLIVCFFVQDHRRRLVVLWLIVGLVLAGRAFLPATRATFP